MGGFNMKFENKAPVALTLKGVVQRGFTELLFNYNIGLDADRYGVVVWYKTTAQNKAQATRLVLPYTAGNSTDIKLTGLISGTTYDISLAVIDEFIQNDLVLLEYQYQTSATVINITEISATTRTAPSFVSVQASIIESTKLWLPNTNISIVLAGASDQLEILLDDGSGYVSFYKGDFTSNITLSASSGTYNVKLIGYVTYFDGTSEVLTEVIYGSTVIVADPSFDLMSSLASLTYDKDQTYEALFNLTAKYASFRFEHSERVTANEALIDASVYIDPTTGLIINRAFAYTDTSFTAASISIDGVEASIVLQAEALTVEKDRITVSESNITVNAADIQLRTTSTQVDGIVAGHLAALIPAYSWQFNQDAEGFTGNTNGTVTGFLAMDAATGATTPTISLDTSTDFIFRIRVKLRTAGTWDGLITYSGGSINVPSPTTEDVYEIITVDASGIGSFTGTITSLVFDLGDVDINSIEIGKRGANDQAFTDISLRTTTIEQDMDSGTGRMSVYATSTSVTNAGYQTETNVNTLIDTWQAIYSVQATMVSLDSNDTINRATTANTWVSAAETNVRAFVATYNTDNGVPGTAEMTVVDQRLDAAEGTITNQIISIQGLSDSLSGTEEAALFIAYQQFLIQNQVETSEIQIATAESTLTAITDENSSTAASILDLTSRVGTSETSITQLNVAFSTELQSSATRSTNLEAKLKVADSVVLASANETMIATVGHCVDAQGDIVSSFSTDAVACENAGHTWQFGLALAESLKQTTIVTDAGTSSVQLLMQTFEDNNNNLVARANLSVNVDGTVDGVFIDGATGTPTNIKLKGGNISFVDPTGAAKFVWDAGKNTFIYTGRIIIVDDISGGTKEITNLTDFSPMQAPPSGTPSGLHMSSTELGYIDAGTWTTYMSSTGDFFLGGTDVTNGLSWDAGSNTLTLGEGSVLRSPKVEMLGTDYMEIQSAIPFGSTNQFIRWSGRRTGANVVTGSVVYSALDELTATTYVKTDGSTYISGSLIAGAFSSTAATTDLSATASTTVGPFGSVGGVITIVWSVVLSSTYFKLGTGTPPAAQPENELGITVVLEELVSSVWTLRSTQTLNSTNSNSEVEVEGIDWISRSSRSISGSSTYTDNQQVTTDRTYRARVTSRSNFFSSGDWTGIQRLGIVTQE